MKSQKNKLIINTPIRTRQGGAPGPFSKNPITPKGNKQNTVLLAQPKLLNAPPSSGLSPCKLLGNRKGSLVAKFSNPQQYATQPLIQTQPIEFEHENSSWNTSMRKVNSSKPSALASSRRKKCANHPQSEAQYKIVIENEVMQYCKLCSVHLASQGFDVQQIGGPNSSRPSIPSVGSRPSIPGGSTPINAVYNQSLQVDPRLVEHPRCKQISMFLEGASTVRETMQKHHEQFRTLKTHYQKQEQRLQEFYEAIIEYMKHVKSQHLGILKTEARKLIQIGQIQCAQIEQNLKPLEEMTSDIQNCVNQIIKNVEEDKYRQAMNNYTRQLELYKISCEQQTGELQKITNLTHKDLEIKLEEFKQSFDDMFGVKEGTESHPTNINPVKPPHQNKIPQNTVTNQHGGNMVSTPLQQQVPQRLTLANIGRKPPGAHSQRQNSTGACRALFSEDAIEQQQHEIPLPEQSPQFKII